MLYHWLYPLADTFSGLNVVRYITFRTAAATLTALPSADPDPGTRHCAWRPLRRPPAVVSDQAWLSPPLHTAD